MLKIAIAGADGRMGRALIAAAAAAQCDIAGLCERPGAAVIGQTLAGAIVTADAAIAADSATVWVDFTNPAATIANLSTIATPTVRAAVVGATGWDSAQAAAIAALAQRFAIVKSGNFSLGVNLLAALVTQAAAKLGADWDIEILEAHHRAKIDAPSGTALLLGEAAAAGRGQPLRDLRLPPHDGVTGPRPPGQIGFAALRGGGIIGDHSVLFASAMETVTLSHHASDRALFATGALAAAHWAADKPPGLYSMADVLGL
jgi:4-hydroxy-tetrahydrodipicolinate reductase